MDTSASLLDRLSQPAQEEAWARFVHLYSPLIYFWARRLGLQGADAADLVQEVLLHLLRKMPAFSYDPRKSFRGWLHTVVLNVHRSRRRAVLPWAADPPDLNAVADSNGDATLDEVEYRRWLVGRALELMQAEFQPNTWKACWQLVIEGRPAAEVSAELGISVGAVYVAKSRVLNRLRCDLDGLLT